jgi:DNA polymerase-1
MKMKNNLLIIDLNNLLIVSISVRRAMHWKGKSTTGISGFLDLMCAYINKWELTDIIVTLDSPPYKRRDLFPEYKLKNKSNLIEESKFKAINEGRKQIKELLDIMNISVLEYKGLEADDVIAEIVNNYHTKYDNLIIASGDSDLIQLLKRDNIIIQKTKDRLYTKEDFKKDFPDIKVEDWYKILSIAGTHNNIKGISGIAIKTAVKNFKINENYWKDMLMIYPELNLYSKLIKLPYEKINDLEIKKPNFSTRNIEAYLRKNYGINLKLFALEAFSILEKI